MLTRIYRDYLELTKAEAESISALKGMNFVLAAQAFVNFLLFVGPDSRFEKPVVNSPWWLGAKVLGTNVEVWEVVFVILSIIMVISTLAMYKVTYFTSLTGVAWVLFGLTWVIGSFVTDQEVLFGSGLLALLVGAGHFSVARAWRAEGVE